MAAHVDPTPVEGVQPCRSGQFGDITYDAAPVRREPYADWWQPTSGVDKGLKVRNSLTAASNDALDPFKPGNGNKVSWYTCGPTVYDSCHMGHARAYLTFDILRRITEDYFRYDVIYHVNITDIDDKIIINSRKNFLLQKYMDQKNAFGDVLKKVKQALDIAANKLQKKEADLQEPLPETASWREKQDRREQEKMIILKADQLREAVQGVEAAEKAKDVDKLYVAAKTELCQVLDEEGGATVTDHSVFMAHAKKYEKEFFEDMESLGVREPDVLTRVTEYVPNIIDFIKKIVDKGLAYESEGSVYLSIDDFKNAGHTYKKLRPGKDDTTEDEMVEGEGALAAEGQKKNPNDFALWKKSKSGEPFWESPWGKGRPGWHIECSVIASDVFGPVIDVHAGGVDLKFPHHDNELAQSEACFGHSQWINYFFHAGHLRIKGLKMSKSLKNFVTIRQALEKFTPREIRMMFLLQPWWKEMNFSDQTVDDAISKDKTFREFFHAADAIIRSNWAERGVGFQRGDADRQLLNTLLATQTEVDAAFKDNFDTPRAIVALCAMVTAFNNYNSDGKPACVHVVKKMATYTTSIFRVLGLTGSDDIGFTEKGEGAGSKKDVVAPYLDALVNFRIEVRAAARAKEVSGRAILEASDRVRDDTLPPLGVRLDDADADKTIWKLDDPDIIMKEVQAKRDAAAAAALKKLEAQAVKLAKEVAKVRGGEPSAMFKSDPEFAKWTFDDAGLPATDPEGTPIVKSKAKALSKRKTAQEKAWTEIAREAEKAGKDVETYGKELVAELAALQQKIADTKTGE
ncbi:putative cysteine--tRNA ligase [Diplonema papillatum]|nr:putative cysteine--tRNA ligase [Diplonema papillatum]